VGVPTEIDTCAACHSRRKVITKNPAPGAAYLDGYLPALLEPGLYHADGQIDGEVYEYGSFLQSQMYHAGVTCSDCHEPHSAKLRAVGNALCAQCHMPAKFDAAEHHHHQPGTAGAQCVNCHMPTKTYMVVDVRRDHSFRVPRPDLSVTLGTPNACTQCHRGRSAEWAAQTVASWFPHGRQAAPHYATALHAGRAGTSDAEQQLDRLILDQSQPAIARASALPLVAPYATEASVPALKGAAGDADPLVRSAAPRALSRSLQRAAVQIIAALLDDPFRAVRIEAARALAEPAAADGVCQGHGRTRGAPNRSTPSGSRRASIWGYLRCGGGTCPRRKRNTAPRCGSIRVSSRRSSTWPISTARAAST